MTTTRSNFDRALDELRGLLLEMGSRVDGMLEQSVRALDARDVSLAEAVIRSDDRVDSLGYEIEERCLHLIALQQPMGRDLRLIASALKVAYDLQRIGDHAVHIGKVTRRLYNELYSQPLVDISRMGEHVRAMLRDTLAAFVNHDITLADRAIASDDWVDAQYHQARDGLHAAMQSDPAAVVVASYLLFAVHYLERVADHAVRIGRCIHYIEHGNRTIDE